MLSPGVVEHLDIVKYIRLGGERGIDSYQAQAC